MFANKYPQRLVPNKELPLISTADIDLIHHLGAWVSGDKPFANPDGELDAGAIDIKRIPGL